VRIFVSVAESVFSDSMVAGSILANASSVGANTVNSPPLRVLTRFTCGFSLPDTAAVRVVSSGLLDAATVTGSCAIPATEPGPVGTFEAYDEQPGPTRLAAGSAGPAIGVLAIGAAAVVIDGDDGADRAESFEHADSASAASTAIPATAAAGR
jgi:hypothetical protein